VTVHTNTGANGTTTVDVQCSGTEKAISGGGSNTQNKGLEASIPITSGGVPAANGGTNAHGWRVIASVTGANSITTYVLCVPV
jgi:hypothetical protein